MALPLLAPLLIACSPQKSAAEPDSSSNFEIPIVNLQDLWSSSSFVEPTQCDGKIVSSVESKNVRVEVRKLEKEGINLCVLQQTSKNHWTRFASTFMPSYSYAVSGEPYENGYVGPGGSTAPWWECTDSTAVLADSANTELGAILVAFRRTWSCHGDAGGTYDQGLLTIFIDSENPQIQVRGLPGLEILDAKQMLGTMYNSQYQLCSAVGYCRDYSLLTREVASSEGRTVSVIRQKGVLTVLYPKETFGSPPLLDNTLFDPRSLPCVFSNLCEARGQIDQPSISNNVPNYDQG